MVANRRARCARRECLAAHPLHPLALPALMVLQPGVKALSWLLALMMAPTPTEIATFDTAIYGKTPAGWMGGAARPGDAASWKVIKDPTAPSQPYVLAHVPSGGPAGPRPAILEDHQCSDGEIIVRFKALSRDAEPQAGLVWRYRDPGNYYYVRANAANRNVILYRVSGGKSIPLAPRGRASHDYTVPHHVFPDSWTILKVVFSGPRMSVYYNHRRILQVEDAHFTGSGRVGVWTRASSAAHFDDFKLFARR